MRCPGADLRSGWAEGVEVLGFEDLEFRVSRSGFKNNYFTEMCSGSEAGSYLRLIDFMITQL